MDCQRCGGRIARRRRGPDGWTCETCYPRAYKRRKAEDRRVAQLEALIELVTVAASGLGRDAVLVSVERAAPTELE